MEFLWYRVGQYYKAIDLGSTVGLEHIGTRAEGVCFDSVGSDGAKWEDPIGKSEIERDDLDAGGIGVLLAPCFSEVLQDQPAPPSEEESFTSTVPNREVEASDNIDLAEEWDFLGASPFW